MGLAVQGPTISTIKAVISAFLGLPTVVNAEEIVEKVISDNPSQMVITDKHIYKLPESEKLSSSISVGKVLRAGDSLSDRMTVIDSITSGDWWNNGYIGKRFVISPFVFIGDRNYQLFVENTVEVATLSEDGKITFPIYGESDDVEKFHEHINSSENIEAVKSALGLSSEKLVSVLNPVDFLFSNFLKNSTLLIKVHFYSADDFTTFFRLWPVIKKYLPPHVYIFFDVELTLDPEEYNLQYQGQVNEQFPNNKISADGSLFDGSRPKLLPEDLLYYKDFSGRLFSIGVSPLRNNKVLCDDSNLDSMIANTQTGPRIMAGSILREFVGKSTKEVSSLLLMDF